MNKSLSAYHQKAKNMPIKKKKTKRSEAKYPALDKTYNLKTRTDLYDFDYINGHHDEETGITTRALNDKEKLWLNNFVEEYVNADFDPNRKRIQKKKKVDHPKNSDLKKIGAVLLDYFKVMNEDIKKSNITNSSKANLRRLLAKFKNEMRAKIKDEYKYIMDYYKKEAYDNNNSRNRCILTKAKASGKYVSTSDLAEGRYLVEDTEDNIIEKLDNMKSLEDSEDYGNDS